MPSIAFVNPSYGPWLYSRASRSPAAARSGTLYYPLWLCYAAGLAEDRGHRVRVLDAVARRWSHQQVVQDLVHFRPDLVVLDTTTPSIRSDLALASLVRDALPETKILAVGTHASALPEDVLRSGPALDAVARREYDESVCDYAEHLDAPQEVSGVAWREGDRIQLGVERDPIPDLDALPFVTRVYRKHLRVQDYYWSTAFHPMVMIVTGRGCPNRCAWCLYPQTLHGRHPRVRSPENVVAELNYVSRELPEVREVGFEDDTFTAHRDHARQICERILQQGLRIRWWANVRADLDRETLSLMKRAGCRLFIVGVESGAQQVLNTMKKGIQIEQVERFMREAHALGVDVRACFVVGQKGETREEMQSTLDLALRLNPETAQFFPMIPYPGTETYEWAKAGGVLVTQEFSEWLFPDGRHRPIVRTAEISEEEVSRFVEMAIRRFYLRPRVVCRSLVRSAFSLQEARRVWAGAKRFVRILLSRQTRE